jgi:hypothetical protein
MRNQIIAKVTELHKDVEVPAPLVNIVRQHVINSFKKDNPAFNETDDYNKEHIEQMAVNLARTEMIRERIIEQEKIAVEDYDYENMVDNFIKNYAIPDMPQMFQRDTLLEQIKKDESAKVNLLHKKYIDFLMDFTKTIEIDYDEYIEKYYNKNELLFDIEDGMADIDDDNDIADLTTLAEVADIEDIVHKEKH